MAIGMGLMVGFRYKENFNYPYLANSITDFWRRWHMSLSSFFRDYVYIPLGGNRKGKPRQALNLLIVWFLTGMWHGAGWNFILWGLYYFVFLALEKFLIPGLQRLPAFFAHLYTLVVVFFGWVLFYFTDFTQGIVVLKGLFGLNGNGGGGACLHPPAPDALPQNHLLHQRGGHRPGHGIGIRAAGGGAGVLHQLPCRGFLQSLPVLAVLMERRWVYASRQTV